MSLTDEDIKDMLLEARNYGDSGTVHVITAILRLPSGESKILAFQVGPAPLKEEKIREIVTRARLLAAPGEEIYFKHGYGTFSLQPGPHGEDNYVWERSAPWVKPDEEKPVPDARWGDGPVVYRCVCGRPLTGDPTSCGLSDCPASKEPRR